MIDINQNFMKIPKLTLIKRVTNNKIEKGKKLYKKI